MRTKKTARNLIISTILTTLVALIGLFKIKVFLAELGDEATGIYQLFTQIFSYISLVDAGLTSSLLYSLYKPVSDENHKKINEILKGGHNFYSKIALIIIAIGIVLSFKIDFFLSDYTLPLNYIRICFILFIVSSGINYFVTPQKVILEARQNLYKVHMVVYTSIIVKGLLEIALLLMHLKLLSLMLLAIGISIIQNIVILIIAKSDYKELDLKDAKPDNSFTKETKNLMVQKVTGIIFNNIDVILISKYISSASVVIYTSYNYIITSIQNIVKKIGSSSLASVGNLLVTDKTNAKNIFYEYNAMCFYIANILCVPLLLVITSFVSIFYGEAYVLPYLGSVSIVIILYFKVIDIPLEVFAEALGYFDKLKKCLIIQSIINLTLSLILLFKIGISGVILATVISFIIGEFALYPQILNKNYFKDDKINYYGHSAKLLVIGIASYLCLYLFVRNITVPNLFYWFLLGLGTFTINLIVVTIYFILTKETAFFARFKRLITERKKNHA